VNVVRVANGNSLERECGTFMFFLQHLYCTFHLRVVVNAVFIVTIVEHIYRFEIIFLQQ